MRSLIFVACILALVSSAPTTSPKDTATALAQFKALIRLSINGMFARADSNHNNEFDKADLKSIFVEYDTNNDSKVTRDEFINAFTKNNNNMTIVAKGLFLELDMDKSGEVTDSDLGPYFKKIDQSKDGKVSEKEFKDYFTELFTILYVLKLKAQGGAVIG